MSRASQNRHRELVNPSRTAVRRPLDSAVNVSIGVVVRRHRLRRRFRKSQKLRRAGEGERLTGYAGTRTRTRAYESNSESNIDSRGYETTLLCFVVTLCAVSSVHADQTIRSLQQTLENQGFYYGAVTGNRVRRRLRRFGVIRFAMACR